MTDHKPIQVKNLDIYGHPPLEWSAVLERLDGASGFDQECFLGTVSPGEHPHIVSIGAVWFQGHIYFTSGPGTLKSQNLARNSNCSVAGRVQGMDLVLEGTASIVDDDKTLEAVAAHYRAAGWPAQVEAGAFTAPYSAQSAGPPPWNLYRLDCQVAHAVTVEEPFCATLWRF